MAGFTNYLEEALLNHVFQQGAYSVPTTIQVGLLTTNPSDDAETDMVEVTGDLYAREEVLSWTISTDVSGLTTASNATVVSFGTGAQPGAGVGGWGTVEGFGIFDAATGGNLLMYGEFSFPITIAEGAEVTFQINDLRVNLQ